ncbi:MAG: UPF0175 family protein [Candidatus Bathyarchaeia archaeon]
MCKTVTVELPLSMLRGVERLAKEDGVAPSELIRRLLDSALREKWKEEALEAYRRGTVTLWRAAEMADISLREMMDLAGDAKIPIPYTLENLRHDIESVKKRTRNKK